MLNLGVSKYMTVFCLSTVAAFAAKPEKQSQKFATHKNETQRSEIQRRQLTSEFRKRANVELELISGANEELRAQYQVTKVIVSDVTDQFADRYLPSFEGGRFTKGPKHSGQSYPEQNYSGTNLATNYRAEYDSADSQGESGGRSSRGQKSSLTNSMSFEPGVISEWADEIINVGTKVWNIVEAGRPVSGQKIESANALPKGVEDWTDLQGWSAPVSRVYSVVYENGFGIKMVELSFRVTFNYGGNYRGRGKYIANASVQIESLRIGFGGIKYDVQVDIPAVFNQGTTQDPVAGMQLNVKRVADTIFSRNENMDSFFLNGLGVLQKL